MAAAAPNTLQEFLCSVCLEFFKDPHNLLPCNHVYCKACIMQLKRSNISHCPQCRTNMTDFSRDKFMAQKMRTTEVQCRKCNKQMPAIEMNQHMTHCAETSDDFARVGGQSQQGGAELEDDFQCPFCQKVEIKMFDLQGHCEQYHKNDKRKVVCPICASMPWGDPTLESSHLISHLQLRHRFSYNSYAEMWETDEESILKQAITESLACLPGNGGSQGSQASHRDMPHVRPIKADHQVPDEPGNFHGAGAGCSGGWSGVGEAEAEEYSEDEAILEAVRRSVVPQDINEPRPIDEDEAIFLAVTESLNSTHQQHRPTFNPQCSTLETELDEDEAIFLAVTESLSSADQQQAPISNPGFSSGETELDEDEAIRLAVAESLYNQHQEVSNSGDATALTRYNKDGNKLHKSSSNDEHRSRRQHAAHSSNNPTQLLVDELASALARRSLDVDRDPSHESSASLRVRDPRSQLVVSSDFSSDSTSGNQRSVARTVGVSVQTQTSEEGEGISGDAGIEGSTGTSQTQSNCDTTNEASCGQTSTTTTHETDVGNDPDPYGCGQIVTATLERINNNNE